MLLYLRTLLLERLMSADIIFRQLHMLTESCHVMANVSVPFELNTHCVLTELTANNVLGVA